MAFSIFSDRDNSVPLGLQNLYRKRVNVTDCDSDQVGAITDVYV